MTLQPVATKELLRYPVDSDSGSDSDDAPARDYRIRAPGANM